MGKNVATLELEFYVKLLKRHTKELFLLINEKCLDFDVNF